MQIHLHGNLLRVKYNDGGQSYATIDPDYKLGTKFTIKIQSAG
jgi:hypothetical protein